MGHALGMNDAQFLKQAIAIQRSGQFQMRSCQECNPAHAHLHDPVDGPLFVCNSCRRWFYRGVDLSALEADHDDTRTPGETTEP